MTREQILNKISACNLVIDTADKGILIALEAKDSNKVDSFIKKKESNKLEIDKLYNELEKLRDGR